MTQGSRPFLTFQGGAAGPALDFYESVFDDFDLLDIVRYGPDGPGPNGTVMTARFRMAGSDFSCADSPIDHAWGFTPAVSMWVDCSSENELEYLFGRLSENGEVFMPAGDYGFSTRFAWVGDQFGVTWQLNVA